MDYSRQQKLAISKILLDILSIDENIDPRETMYFEKVKELLELSAQDHYDVLGLNTLKCMSIVKAMNEQQKMEFARMMREMIVADQFIDPNEASAFYDLCDFIGIKGIGLSV